MLKYIRRETGKWHDILPIAIIWAVMIAWLVFIIGYTAPETAIMRLFSDNEETVEFLEFYFSFIKVWIILIPIFLIKYNRPMLGQLILGKGGNTVLGAFIGLLLGFAANGACILFSVLKGDITLSFSRFDPGLLILFFIVIFIQCGAEEIIDRLYLYQKLRRRYKLFGNSNPWQYRCLCNESPFCSGVFYSACCSDRIVRDHAGVICILL